MNYIPDIHQRRSVRLKGYDYTRPGAYFVTICTQNRECLFGAITVGAGSKPAPGTILAPNRTQDHDRVSDPRPVMQLNEYGEQVVATWMDLPNHNANLVLNAFVVMPNHVHFIIVITDRAGLEPAPTLGEIVRQFKTFSAKRINKLRGMPGIPVWQRNYYERVIRSDGELSAIREYIANNPAQWTTDTDNPAAIRKGKP